MAPLLTCQNISKAFGAQTLFTGINLVLHPGDRAGLIGPNGSGKSTLLKILCRQEAPDSGTLFSQKHVRTSYLAQEDVFAEEKSAVDNLYSALQQEDIDESEQYNRIHALLSRAQFADPGVKVSQLSGGWRKRLAICRALLVHPDILVMDEPTNHLDIEGILWLENLLAANLPESPAAFLLVSHDRRFLENTVNRVIELAPVYPEGSFEVKGNYSDFLEKKAEQLVQQQQHEVRLANKMRRETEWLRRGPKARATKAKYRIDEAGRLQDELDGVRSRNRSAGRVQIAFDSTNRKSKKLLQATGLTKGFDGPPLFSDLDILLTPGSRLGLLGRNGCGKSTLMQLLAAAGDPDCHPETGFMQVAENVRIVNFDQQRIQLDQSLTLRRALAPDGDSVLYQGRNLHVVTWAKRFLFRTDQLDTPVNRLSGGEQARILIARLMLQPADILLLDEPTNDLDIPSLDVLEESLTEFDGALVLVTHDRFLLDRVCDQVLGFDGRGGTAYFADYEQWLNHLQDQEERELKKSEPAGRDKKQQKPQRGKLSYMDQREYDQMEDAILSAETRLEELQHLMTLPEAMSNPELLQEYWQEEQQLQARVDELYSRWDELEQRKQGPGQRQVK